MQISCSSLNQQSLLHSTAQAKYFCDCMITPSEDHTIKVWEQSLNFKNKRLDYQFHYCLSILFKNVIYPTEFPLCLAVT